MSIEFHTWCGNTVCIPLAEDRNDMVLPDLDDASPEAEAIWADLQAWTQRFELAVGVVADFGKLPSSGGTIDWGLCVHDIYLAHRVGLAEAKYRRENL